MRKNYIFGYTDTFILNPSSKVEIYNYRLISLLITMIHSSILARQCIFLKVLVSMHPHKSRPFYDKTILMKGGIKNNDYNNLNTNFSYTQSFRLYQIINNSLGLCFHRDNC